MIQKAIVAIVALVLASAHGAFAVTGVQLSIQGTDVVLRWPSQPCRIYIVGYRPAFDPATPWTFLTTTLPASAGSETTFTHSGAFQGGGGQQMAAAAGGSSPPSRAVALSAEERRKRIVAARESAEKAIAYLMAQLEAAVAQDWHVALENYAFDVRNGDDTTGSVAIIAGLSNDLAPGAGNFVLNALLR